MGGETKRVILLCINCAEVIVEDVPLGYGNAYAKACNKCNASWRPMFIAKELKSGEEAKVLLGDWVGKGETR